MLVMHWNLVTDDEVRTLDMPDQYLAFAEAYLESAIRLCEILVQDNAETTYTRGAVILYLAFQSTELFLKGAILRRDPNSSLASSHKLPPLITRYKSLYPGNKFSFSALFAVNTPDLTDADPETIRQYSEQKRQHEKKNPDDQRYRYPRNKRNEPWAGSGGFEANLFLKDLQRFKGDFDSIVKEIRVTTQLK